MSISEASSKRLLNKSAGFILFILLFFVGRSTSWCQVGDSLVRLELKSGRVIAGKVIQLEYERRIQLVTLQGDTLTTEWVDIQHMDFNAKYNPYNLTVTPKRLFRYHVDSSYYFTFDLGPHIGLRRYATMSGVMHFGIGKALNEYSDLNLVTGIEWFYNPEVAMVPIGLEFNKRKRKQGLSTLYYVQAGSGLVIYSEFDNHTNSKIRVLPYVNPGIGITNKTKQNSSWYLKFGYKVQPIQANYDAYVWDGIFGKRRSVFVQEKYWYHLIDIRWGWIFN